MVSKRLKSNFKKPVGTLKKVIPTQKGSGSGPSWSGSIQNRLKPITERRIWGESEKVADSQGLDWNQNLEMDPKHEFNHHGNTSEQVWPEPHSQPVGQEEDGRNQNQNTEDELKVHIKNTTWASRTKAEPQAN